MSANLKTPVIDNPIEQNGGVVWHRLHSEREDICEALLKEPLENETSEPDLMSTTDARGILAPGVAPGAVAQGR